MDFNAWMAGNNFPYTSVTSSRAVDAWRRINDKPTSITVKRGTTLLDAQTVRIEFDNANAMEQPGAAGNSSRRDLVIFGVKDHPTEDNTDLQRDDRFALNGVQYRIIDVIATTGEIQANAEALS